jgi:peptidoglycan/xylan/chitin deacetylase (PgdA/CDA1 family)
MARVEARQLSAADVRLKRYIRRLFTDRGGPVILMFHRIADPACDPWGLSVVPSRFEEQISGLKAWRIPLCMNDFVKQLEDGTLPQLAVAVTFDDGYVDNLRVAKPILEAIGVPATVFLTTGYLGTQKEFWWDELARLVLTRREAAAGAIVVGGRSIAVDLPELPGRGAVRSTWRAWQPPRTARERLYFEIWDRLRVLELRDREEGIESVRRLFGDGPISDADFPMNAEEVTHLLAGTGIEIGAHSVTHQPLTTLPVPERRREIEQSRAACEALAGKSITGFAYPHGDRDAVTRELVCEGGFRWACSTKRAAADPSQFDLFDLPRVQACNWTGSEMKRALNGIGTGA